MRKRRAGDHIPRLLREADRDPAKGLTAARSASPRPPTPAGASAMTPPRTMTPAGSANSKRRWTAASAA